MVTPEGEPKVLDFGLAKHLAPAMPGPTTHTGQVLGTSWYMSPEQIRGSETGPASDQFSLAIVLFEWLSETRPFVGDSAYETVEAIVQRAPSRLDVEAPWCGELERVLLRALEKEPEKRYPDMAAFAEDLELAVTGGRPGGGRSPREERRAWRSALRACAILLTFVLTMKLGLDALRPDPDEADPNMFSLGFLPFELEGANGVDEWAAGLDRALAFALRAERDKYGFHLVSPEAATDEDRLELSYRYGAEWMLRPTYAHEDGFLTVHLEAFRYDGANVLTLGRVSSESLPIGEDREAICGKLTRSAFKKVLVVALSKEIEP